ncbi:hypothetical protein BH09BAC1_BH09BAC1_22010 [soil metagenome]
MSRGFVKEYEDQWLGDVDATVPALGRYLTAENGGAKVTETNHFRNSEGREVHEMSNGLCYVLDHNERWMVVLDC